MTALTAAVERRQWTLVSLRLLVAVAEVAERLPEGSLDALLDLLADPQKPGEEKKR